MPCRSELAREKPTDAAFIQEARVIVDAFREQARSYRGSEGGAIQPFLVHGFGISQVFQQPRHGRRQLALRPRHT